MDTQEKEFKKELQAEGVIVEKYSGTINARPYEFLRVGKEAFKAYAKKHGIALHRDLHDLESPQEGTKTDKEEYTTFQACGRPIIIDIYGE